MATGHILPGYGDPVTRLRRVQSVGYPLDSSILTELERNALLSQREFSQIKENARNLWSKQPQRATTYETFFSDGEIREITRTRPTSSHRRNNPHPTQLFMTNKLHFIEGYHKPDTTIGRSAYKVDASLSPAVQVQRQSLREKYISRPDSSQTSPYKDPYGFKKFLPPTEAQAAEAWVKLADDTDYGRLMEALNKQADILKLQDNEFALRPRSAYPSLQRWMRLSGPEEQESISRRIQTPNSYSLHKNESCGNQAPLIYNYGFESERKFGYYPQLRRGEFSIHPDWHSSLPHHRVP